MLASGGLPPTVRRALGQSTEAEPSSVDTSTLADADPERTRAPPALARIPAGSVTPDSAAPTAWAMLDFPAALRPPSSAIGAHSMLARAQPRKFVTDTVIIPGPF